MQKRVIITGGAGYVGASLVEVLQADDRVLEIVVYDCLIRNDRRFFFAEKESFGLSKVRFVQGDILDTRKLSAACAGMDVLVHLAAFVDEPYNHSQHIQYDQVNAFGTMSVVRAIEETPTIRKVVHLSSTAVYGFRKEIHPSDKPNPQNGYAISKYRGELFLEGLSQGNNALDLKTLRSGHIHGCNRVMRYDTLVHAFLFEATTGGLVQIHGNGEQIRSFVALHRVAAALAIEVFEDHFEHGSVLADFQCDVNRILTWLQSRMGQIEYRYLTPAIKHPSQSFQGLPGIDEPSMDATLQAFQDSFVLSGLGKQ